MLDSTGYMVRAAFIDGPADEPAPACPGRAFIPLLSSFACAVPGIMATRTIDDPQGPADHYPGRAADDLLGAAAGLYADHRARLFPTVPVLGIGLQGCVLFGLYVTGIAGALLRGDRAAAKTAVKGAAAERS